MVMIIGSKVMVVVMVIFGVFLLLCGLMVLFGIRKVDKEDRLYYNCSYYDKFFNWLFTYNWRYTVMANLKATRKEFEDYVNLQRDGVVNMNEMDKVLRLTRLTPESYEDIINHYEEYVKAYPIKEFKYSPEDE